MNAYVDGPTGVGGWLGFFVVALGLFSPGKGLVQMLSFYSDPSIAEAFGSSWTRIQIAEWTLFALSVAASWYLVWRLLKVQNRRTVYVVIGGIWLISVGGVIVELLIVSLGSALPLAGFVGLAGMEAARPIIFCTVWTIYFLVSKRVANTYGGKSGDGLVEVFR